jgi:NAD(P)H-hydrate epimerase
MNDAGRKQLSKLLPKRKKTDNKTAGGKCLIIAGSPSMPGAGILAARAAARVGAGYVYLACNGLTRSAPPDFLRIDPDKKIDFSQFQSVAIGPGLGTSPKSKKLIKRHLTELKKLSFENVVIDADAINFLSANTELLPLPESWVITPHAGELSRLLKLSRSMQAQERIKYLKPAHDLLKCILVLKGSPTFLYDGRKVKPVKFGNKALAKAGTGDVLTGMIAGFMAQGLSGWDASYLAASLHGMMADDWVKSKDYLSLMASDLIEAIPATLFKLRK